MPDVKDGPIGVIEPLGSKHDRAAFSCAKYPVLESYIKTLARQDARRNLAAPFVLVSPESRAVISYYTLSATNIHLPDLPESQIKKDRLPADRVIPATLLGRLAVDDAHQGRGLGAFLLTDALRRSLLHADEIGSYAVVVDAIDDMAAAFYRHIDFIAMPALTRRLYLPMGTIAALF